MGGSGGFFRKIRTIKFKSTIHNKPTEQDNNEENKRRLLGSLGKRQIQSVTARIAQKGQKQEQNKTTNEHRF